MGWGRGREDDSDDGVDYGERLWALIREGHKPVPGRQSPEFLQHLEDFLQSQLKSAGSGGPGAVAEGEDLSSVPFAKVRAGIVQRYAKWLEKDHPRGQPKNKGQFRDKDEWESKEHQIQKLRDMLDRRGAKMPRRKVLDSCYRIFEHSMHELIEQDRTLGSKMSDGLNAAFSVIPTDKLLAAIRAIRTIRFYPTNELLQDEWLRGKEDNEEKQDALAFWREKDQSLHLNGGLETDEDDLPLRKAYAHELAHAVDFALLTADDKRWVRAWRRELTHNELGKQAAKDHREAFGAFCELAWFEPKKAKRAFPMCWRAFVDLGMRR